MIGPLSIRTLLVISCAITSLPLLWRERAYLLRQRILWMTGVFVLLLAVSALWGHHLGNSATFIANDLTTFSALLLMAMVLALRLTMSEVERLLTALFAAAFVLAAFTVVVHFLTPKNLIDANTVSVWLTERSFGGFADAGGGILRIYLRSQIMFIPALLIGLQRGGASGDRPRARYLAGSAVLTMGLMVSLTRSLWIGTLAALAVMMLWGACDIASLLRPLGIVAVGLAALIGVSTAVYGGPALLRAAAERLSPGLVVIMPEDQPSGAPGDNPLRSAEPTPKPRPSASGAGSTADDPEQNAEAVEIRSRTLQLHKERIQQRPLTGWGLGYNLDSIRDDGRTEYMYWDLLMKLGVPGFAVFVALYAWAPVQTLLRGARTNRRVSTTRVLSASLVGVAATSYFNPFLNSILGIILLLLLVGASAAQLNSRRGALPNDSAPRVG
jgi:hypothetical protein